MTRPRRPLAPGPTVVEAPRVLLAVLGAAVLGVGAHVAGGGALPATWGIAVGVLGAATSAVVLGRVLAQRHRSSWPTLLAIGAGQLVIELALRAGHEAPDDPLAALALHLAANLLLGALLVGADRLGADLAAVLDRLVPVVTGGPGPPVRVAGAVVVAACGRAAPAGPVHSPASPRGPPGHQRA